MSSSSEKHERKPRPVPRPRTSDEFGCNFCPGGGFRRSRLRPQDFATLMTLRYPVRCLRCSRRQVVSFALAGLSVPASINHNRVRTQPESWRNWTTGEAGRLAGAKADSATGDASGSVADPGLRSVGNPSARRPPQGRGDDIS